MLGIGSFVRIIDWKKSSALEKSLNCLGIVVAVYPNCGNECLEYKVKFFSPQYQLSHITQYYSTQQLKEVN